MNSSLIQLLLLDGADVPLLQAALASAKSFATQLKDEDRNALQSMTSKLIKRIVLERGQITIYLCAAGLAEHLPAIPSGTHDGAKSYAITTPINIRRRGQEMKMVLGAKQMPASNVDGALVLLLGRAVLLRHLLEVNEITSTGEFAEAHGMHHSDVDLSRFSSGFLSHLGGHFFEGHG